MLLCNLQNYKILIFQFYQYGNQAGVSQVSQKDNMRIMENIHVSGRKNYKMVYIKLLYIWSLSTHVDTSYHYSLHN